MKSFLNNLMKHPPGALYGTLLGFIAFSAAVPMCASGMWDAAAVDLAMALILIYLMLKQLFSTAGHATSFREKTAAWAVLVLADIIALLPTHSLAGGISTAFAFTLLIFSFVLYSGGTRMAAVSIAPALWCCIFMPYHEEIMLLLSFPLRLSATVLSNFLLNLCGISTTHSGTSLILPQVNISITDACSGIKQLDAFILICFAAVQILYRKAGWKILHFAFIMPSIIFGNTLRIVITVLLYRIFGEAVFENTWHTLLGYTQIIFAILLFLAAGILFSAAEKQNQETGS